MRDFSASPKDMLGSFICNRKLIMNLVKRSVIGRYRGSILGLLWSFFNPIFMLAVYTFVFSIVFQSRWNGGSGSKSAFALLLFAGLIVFNLFAECITSSPSLIISNANYVKRVIFPLEILPIVNLGSALFHALVSTFVWLIFYCIEIGVPHITVLLFPVVLLPLIFIILGLSWILASLSVYIRDIGQLVGILITVLMFLSPIFYPIEALPKAYRPILNINPLTLALAHMRDILYFGKLFIVSEYLIYFLISFCFACLGFAWFQKTRKGFADVL